MSILPAILLFPFAIPAFAKSTTEIVCTYAPSQSKAVAAVSHAAGVSATAGAIAAATGLSAVVHSSGALILTGSSGYIAGTLGAPAIAFAATPVIVAVGLAVGGTAVTLELVCASKNHPDQVTKINDAAAEFSLRFSENMQKAKSTVGNMRESITPLAEHTAIEVKRGTSDVWKYAYQKSVELSAKKLW